MYVSEGIAVEEIRKKDSNPGSYIIEEIRKQGPAPWLHINEPELSRKIQLKEFSDIVARQDSDTYLRAYQTVVKRIVTSKNARPDLEIEGLRLRYDKKNYSKAKKHEMAYEATGDILHLVEAAQKAKIGKFVALAAASMLIKASAPLSDVAKNCLYERKEAIESLIKAHGRMVLKKAVGMNHGNPNIDIEEFVSAGMAGLHRAAELYDYDAFKTKFITYAFWAVKSSMLKLIGENKTLRNATTFPFDTTDDQPEPDLEALIGRQDNTAFDNLYQEDCRRKAEKFLELLDDRERFIVERHYGIGGSEMKLKEIGNALHLTKTRVAQLEQRAIKKMQEQLGIASEN